MKNLMKYLLGEHIGRKYKSSIPKPAPNYIALLVVIAAQIIVGCNQDDDPTAEPWMAELEQLKTVITPYHDINVAIEEGFTDVTGYRTQMGYHYAMVSRIDDKFELEQPEILLYAHDGAGDLQLVAVEYATPIADMDNPPPAPEGFTGNADVWEINTEFNLWTLHVWTNLENPDGIFTALNPELP